MQALDFSRRADELAPEVLGLVLWHGQIGVRLTEVEAYLGLDDPASHAFRGPRGRAATMFGEPGRLYVYLSYGIHLAANLVCSPAGQASALLLRAGEVVAGEELARARRVSARSRATGLAAARLASGPGNLGRVLGLTRQDDGAPLGEEFFLQSTGESVEVGRGPRVGISVATDWPLRFWIIGDPTVSTYRRGARQ
ncbi:MAG: DNA-3-methyladenine glycosylase [Brooklawnia sp.]|nr:DNA-3-methyladenine glycosylase [Brooklawnia sp.]